MLPASECYPSTRPYAPLPALLTSTPSHGLTRARAVAPGRLAVVETDAGVQADAQSVASFFNQTCAPRATQDGPKRGGGAWEGLCTGCQARGGLARRGGVSLKGCIDASAADSSSQRGCNAKGGEQRAECSRPRTSAMQRAPAPEAIAVYGAALYGP